MPWLDAVAWLFACRHLLDAWLEGSLFAGLRASLEARGGLLAEGLLCRLCLSTYVALGVGALLVLAPGPEEPGALFARLPVYALAVAGGVRFLDQLTAKDVSTDDTLNP